MAVTIRPAVEGDGPGICTVHVRAIRETCARAYSAEQVTAWSGLLSPDSYRAVIRERVVVVATEGGAVVGFGQLDPEGGEVDAVYVLPERQGEGIGRELLEHLEEAARARALPVLHLSATLNAVSFYERAGYLRSASTLHRLPTGEDLPCERMAKRLLDCPDGREMA
jgi:putative acetyltransferase